MSEKAKTLVPTLKTSNASVTLATQAKIRELSEHIVKCGYGRQASISYAAQTWGISEKQAEKYYYAALKYLVPEDAERWRELLVARNFSVLEGMLQKALEREDLQAAVQIMKLMNTFLGVSDKKLEVDTKDTKITVSFGD